MSIRKTSNGRYQARYRDAAGRQRTKNFRAKGEARAFLDQTRATVRAGTWHDPQLAKTRFGDWATSWLDSELTLRPTTRDLYGYILRTYLLPEFGKVPLGSITPLHVRDWMAALSEGHLSAASVHRCFRLLRRVLNAAVSSGLVATNPTQGVKPPSPGREEMRFLTPCQVRELADAIDPAYKSLVLTAALTGLRWGELAGLTVESFDPDRGTLTVASQLVELNGRIFRAPPKTETSRRSVRIPAFLAEGLRSELAARGAVGDDPIFPSKRNGKLLRRYDFRRSYWLPAVAATGLDGLRFHDLRHTSVALAIAQGAHAKTIQHRLGHSSITMTLDRYGHLLPTLDDDLAKGLDSAFSSNAVADAAVA